MCLHTIYRRGSHVVGTFESTYTHACYRRVRKVGVHVVILIDALVNHYIDISVLIGVYLLTLILIIEVDVYLVVRG